MNVGKFFKFWGVAKAVASMSKDPSTKVGAVALDDNFNIIATGYNGFPRGVKDSPERYADRPTKLALTSHAEANLVAQAAYGGRALRGSTVILTSLFPCSSCAKSLIQAGVVRIITVAPDTNPRWAKEAAVSSLLFAEAGVEIIQFMEEDPMPVSKKPRKSRIVRRNLLRPLNIRDEMKTDLPILMASKLIGTKDFGMKQLVEILVHAEIVKGSGEALAHPEAKACGLALMRATETAIARYKRLGVVGLSGDEIKCFRENLAVTIPWVRTVPNTLIQAIVTDERKAKGLTPPTQ